MIDDASSSDKDFIARTLAKREAFFEGVATHNRAVFAFNNLESGLYSPRELAALAQPEDRPELFRRRACANIEHHKCASCGSKDVETWYAEYLYCNREDEEVISYHWAETDESCGGPYYYWTSP